MSRSKGVGVGGFDVGSNIRKCVLLMQDMKFCVYNAEELSFFSFRSKFPSLLFLLLLHVIKCLYVYGSACIYDTVLVRPT